VNLLSLNVKLGETVFMKTIIKYSYLLPIFLLMSCLKLTVINGSGSQDDLRPGSGVRIEADPAPEGQEFWKWVGDTEVFLAATHQEKAIVIMLDKDRTLTATYADSNLPRANLTVVNGMYGGSFLVGDVIPVISTDQEGYLFSHWVGDVEHLDDPNVSEAYITMPNRDISIQAKYKKDPDAGKGPRR